MRAFRRTLAAISAPWLLLGLIRGLDRADASAMGTLELGSRDELAHLATSLLVLVALGGPRRMLANPAATTIATASSMLIDLDHLPIYLPVGGLDVQIADGRPFTHSAPTVAALAAAAAFLPRRRRTLAAMSGGVALHFVRDIATGTGLPLWFPFEQRLRRLPYGVYSRALQVLAAVATVRLYRWALASSAGRGHSRTTNSFS